MLIFLPKPIVSILYYFAENFKHNFKMSENRYFSTNNDTEQQSYIRITKTQQKLQIMVLNSKKIRNVLY